MKITKNTAIDIPEGTRTLILDVKATERDGVDTMIEVVLLEDAIAFLADDVKVERV